MTNHDDRGVLRFVAGFEHAAHRGRHAERRKEVRLHQLDPQRLARCVRVGPERQPGLRVSRDAREGRDAAPPILEHRIGDCRHAGDAAFDVGHIQGDELAPIRNGRERVADDAIHPGKDGSVGADAESDQEHDGQCEPGIGGEATNRVAKVSPD